MKKRLFALLLFWMVLAFSACAQTSFIKQAGAFAAERKTGTEMIDDNGNPVHQPSTMQYNIYVEIAGSVPEWKHAWYKNQLYSISTTKIDVRGLEVGIDKQTGKKVKMQPKKGNQLWQLELLPADSIARPPVKLKTGEVLLEGLQNKKSFYFRIQKMIFLQTPDAV